MKRRRVIVGLVVLALVAVGCCVLYLYDQQPPRDKSGHLYDPIEDDPAIRPLLVEADREAKRQMEEMRIRDGRPGKPWLGDCHFGWAVKKKYLKDKHGIDWRTPAEMNPHIIFD